MRDMKWDIMNMSPEEIATRIEQEKLTHIELRALISHIVNMVSNTQNILNNAEVKDK